MPSACELYYTIMYGTGRRAHGMCIGGACSMHVVRILRDGLLRACNVTT